MPFVRWLAHVVRATLWLALHLIIAGGLFLLSAHFFTQPGEDERNGAYFFRALGSLWLYIAAWSWLVRGVLQRPARPATKAKPTGAEVAKGTAGCLANLVPIPFVFVFAGRAADWAWAGIASGDPDHPAHRAWTTALDLLFDAMDNPERWAPMAVGAFFAANVLRIVLRAKKGGDAPSSARTPGRQARDANAATLAKLRKKAKRTAPGGPARAPGRDILAAAGAASAATVGAAHAGAHGPDPGRFQSARSAHEDRILGALSFSSSDAAWWSRRDEGFPVRIAGGADGPDPESADVARQVVQRSFEVLLRASEAARPVAQGRGVGLPRFNITAVQIDGGRTPDVVVHLQCDADAGHQYAVVSSDGLHTFRTA